MDFEAIRAAVMACDADTAAADAFRRAFRVRRNPRKRKAARPPAPEYRGMRQCFRNFGSPLDGRI